MQNNQTLFLERIRTALDAGNEHRTEKEELALPPDDAAIVHTITSRGREERLALLQQLTENGAALGLKVHICASRPDAAARIAAIAHDNEPEFGATREIVMHDHPLLHTLPLAPLLAPKGIGLHLTLDAGPEVRHHTVNAYIGITVAAWAIAESATIVQLTRPGQPRSTSLVPSLHIGVLPLSHLLATLDEAYALIRREPDLDSVVFISGPSKTADIEATMVYGAHGPKAMHLIVLTDEPATEQELSTNIQSDLAQI